MAKMANGRALALTSQNGLISLKMIMDSAKNEGRIISFKNIRHEKG